MKAIKSIGKGEEILNDYGPLPRSDLLRRYGYVSSRYAAYDVVEFSLKSICEVMGQEDLDPKLEFLDDLGLLEDGYTVCRAPANATLDEVISDDMKILIATLLASDLRDRKGKPPKPRIGDAEAHALQKLVLSRQAEYATSVSEDREILEKLAPSTSTRRLKMAIGVRLGEKEILQQLSQMASNFFAESGNE
jgi:N-lysine methyltransferase SETD6